MKMRGNPSRYGAWGRIFNAAALLALALLWLGPATAGEPAKILALGDSLTAGYGLPDGKGFTAQLEAALRERGHNVTVINGGVSGDTTAGGRSRLDWALADQPDIVIVELGANDGLRGLDPAVTRDNLDAILAELKKRGIPVLLAGMYAPPNLGQDYGKRFNAIYPDLARKYGVAFYPFFLDGVAADPALNQADGMHPNEAGVAAIVKGIVPHLLPLLDRSQG